MFYVDAKSKETGRLVTILYHDVVDGGWDSSGFPGSAAARYKLTKTEFERHIQHMSRMGDVQAVSVFDALIKRDPRAFVFTVDDGGACAMHIADRLEKLGWRCHFFITTDRIGSRTFVSGPQIRELHDRGHVIGSHSCSHPDWMSRLPTTRLDDEWQRSASVLAQVTGSATRTGSVPGGYFAESVARSARNAGIEVLFNSEPTTALARSHGCLVAGRFTVRRADSAARSAALVGGHSGARLRQKMVWDAKGLVKSFARPVWDKALRIAYGRPTTPAA